LISPNNLVMVIPSTGLTHKASDTNMDFVEVTGQKQLQDMDKLVKFLPKYKNAVIGMERARRGSVSSRNEV
ncbi:hypothetical protein FRC11_003741, partial [Ceratobasidium sp. 423]